MNSDAPSAVSNLRLSTDRLTDWGVCVGGWWVCGGAPVRELLIVSGQPRSAVMYLGVLTFTYYSYMR